MSWARRSHRGLRLSEDTYCKTGGKRQSSTFFSVIEVENLPYFFSRLHLGKKPQDLDSIRRQWKTVSTAGSAVPKAVSSSPKSVGFSHCSCARCLLSQLPASRGQLVLVDSPSRLCPCCQLPLWSLPIASACLPTPPLLPEKMSSLLPHGRLCWEHHSSPGASVRGSSC